MTSFPLFSFFFFFNDTATTEIYTLSLHDALPIYIMGGMFGAIGVLAALRERERTGRGQERSEEHTSELQSLRHLVCRLLLEKKKKKKTIYRPIPSGYIYYEYETYEHAACAQV